MDKPGVSFIIPHKGREELLQATLQSICDLETESPLEVIVVTQNSSLSKTTLAFENTLNLRLLYVEPSLTISTLRNLGVKDSNSSHLAFLDADIKLSKNWVEAMLGELSARPNAVLVSAIQIHESDATILERIRTVLSNRAVDTSFGFLPGRNLLLSRQVFDQIGGFPEHLLTCEDYWFTGKAAEKGVLWYSSKATYVHLGEDRELRAMFRKEIWRGQSNIASLADREIRFTEWPSFFVPPGIVFLALLTLLLGLFGLKALAVVSGVMAALPFLAYVTRLYFLGKYQLPFGSIVAFYAVYFPARAYGSLLGLFRSMGKNLHD
ncbi:MAG: glycosyltransferase family A protein [Pseudomonadota bacterium]